MTLVSLRRARVALLIVVGVVLAFGLAPTAAAQSFADVELGPAPSRDESQDISNWVYRAIPKAAKTRGEVAQLYNTQFVPGNAVALNWTGTIVGCVAGTTNADHQQAVITRINYFRALADLPAVVLEGAAPTTFQAAALMMTANNTLSHTPPPTFICYSADGAAGAASSNLALGISGVGAINNYIDDFGASNTHVGHRRWVLFPPRTGMATGDTTGNPANRAANSLSVFGPSGSRPATPNGVAWPPAGFVPYQNLPSQSNRWSLSFPSADFANATVTMSGPSGAIPVTQEPLTNGFGDNTIVFLPMGVSYAQPAADTTYTITVSNIGGGAPSSIQYMVTVIDPAASPPGPATATAVEFYNAALDHYFLTHIAGEIAILDAGVTIQGWARTGQSFSVYTSAGAGTSPVCRYYIPPGKGNSHFYGRGATECNATGQANPSFVNEDSQFFHVVLPTAGVCPAGLHIVYRVFSNRPDANHRYMTDRALRDLMVTRGWLAEGDGPDLVVMCVP